MDPEFMPLKLILLAAFCEKNCVGFQRDTGECSNCTGGFELPNCCNCSDNKINVNGICSKPS